MRLIKIENNEFTKETPYLVLNNYGDLAVLWCTYAGELMCDNGFIITDFTQFKEIYEINID